MFERGRCYTREEIHDQCGGGMRDYLPHVEGRVVCVCVTLDMNPHAPGVLLVGTGADVERYGAALARQREPLPVFLKHATHEWRYLGEYVVTGSSSSEADFERWAARAGRKSEVKLIVFMHPSPY